MLRDTIEIDPPVQYETVNATIESTKLGIDRGFVLCAWLFLDYGGAGQGFGGYVLHKTDDDMGTGPLFAGHYINRVLQVVGVESWEDLPGKPIRVRHTHSRVIAIGHYLKDDWFDPAADFKPYCKG